MPDLQGHLSPAEISFILQWVTTKHGSSPYQCPICGHANWLVDEYVTQAIVFPVQANMGIPVSPVAWPVVRLMCTFCAHVISFNAVIMGLYPIPPTPPSSLPRRG